MARAITSLAACLLLLMLSAADAQVLKRYSQSTNNATQIALGYPVPLPRNSQTPVDGFRSYAGLLARHQDLALRSPFVKQIVLGNTLGGRPIYGYQLSDADAAGTSGGLEGAVILDGGIHAREWQSPEVVTGVMERLVAQGRSRGVARYLLENLDVVLIPVLNVDGFLQTQRYPDQIWEGADPDFVQWPRDGRMRRKNMRDVDEVMSTTTDHLFGIDLNRNNAPYWATSSSSSSDRRRLTHHGAQPASEPEIVALQRSGALFGTQLRLYQDVHSYTMVLFSVLTGNPSTDSAVAAYANVFTRHHAAISTSARFPAGRIYLDSPDSAGVGIGTTSEYFANTYQVPSWTLELEPGENGPADYGLFTAHGHAGFALPDAEIRRVREQVAETQLQLFYMASGPAILLGVDIEDEASKTIVYSSRWVPIAERARVLERSADRPLRSGGRYRMVLRFDKPMREQLGGQATLSPGVVGSVSPRVRIGDALLDLSSPTGRWLFDPGSSGEGYERYPGDSYALSFTMPSAAGGGRLVVDTVDLLGRGLDVEPGSVADWSAGAWRGAETGDFDDKHAISSDSTPRLIGLPAALTLLEGEARTLSLRRTESNVASSIMLSAQGVGINPLNAVLQWAAGDTSAREVVLQASDDGVVRGPLPIRIQTSAASQISAEFPTSNLTVLDNDTAAQRVWLLSGSSVELATGLREIASTAPTGADTLIVLPASSTLEDFAGLDDIRAGQTVRVDGQGSTIRLRAGARFAQVLSAGSLQLSDLQIEGGAGTDLGGQLRNAGALELERVQLRGGVAAEGGAIYTTGTLQADRLSVREAAAALGSALHVAGGVTTLRSSDVLDTGITSTFALSGGVLDINHVSVRSAGTVLVASGGQLQTGRSALFGATLCALNGGSVLSRGYNALSDSSCGVAAQDVQLATVFASGTAVAANSPAAVLVPAGLCAGVDLAGGTRARGAACAAGASEPIFPIARGLWWDPARSGQGFDVQLVDGVVFVVWYSYEANGQPIVYTAQGGLQGDRVQADLLQFQEAEIIEARTPTRVGSVDLRFTANDRASLQFALNGATSTWQLEAFRVNALPLHPRSGLYFDPNDSGWGLTLQVQGDVAIAVTYFYDDAGRLRWFWTQDRLDGFSGESIAFSGFCPTCATTPTSFTRSGALDLSAATSDQLSYRSRIAFSKAAGGRWDKTVWLQRFSSRP